MAKSFTQVTNKVTSQASMVFYREPNKAILSGVCSGIASAIDQPSWIVRSVFFFLLLITGMIPMTIFYLLLTIVLEKKPLTLETDDSLFEVGINQIVELESQLKKFKCRVSDLEYFILSDDFNAHIFNDPH